MSLLAEERIQVAYVNEVIQKCDMAKIALRNAASILGLLDGVDRHRILCTHKPRKLAGAGSVWNAP
jgi:hypothetical protein